MSDSIVLLPDVVANQIAAGEVVNRPASVVKEMMENAVDAGSTEIIVNYRDGGKELIQIIDNGRGMSVADARMCFERHATSKIRRVEDIYSLSTFGFRGEALASIAAVSEVELTTRRDEDALATHVCVSGGKFKSQEAAQAEVGTRFMIKNLFYNVPARRRFLEKSTTEAKHINTEFIRVALCNPDKAFSLYNNDAPLYQMSRSVLKTRIVQLLGKHMINNLLEVKADTSIIRIEGYVGAPNSSKQNNKDQFLFVNNRYFKSGYFHKAIMQAYEKLIPSNTQPAYFLYLSIDAERIDVNVHPQKTEIKFEDNTAVWQIINAAVRESLAKTGVVPMMDFESSERIEIPTYKSADTMVYREPAVSLNANFNPFKNTDFEDFGSSVSQDNFEISEDDDYQSMIMEYIEGEVQSSFDFDAQQATIGSILPLERGKYFATTINSTLAIVDLKRAYSCVLYERYRTMIGNGNSASAQLMFPLQVSLSPQSLALVREYRADLEAFGFEFETEDSMVKLTALPADFSTGDAERVFGTLIEMLDQDKDQSSGELRVDYLARIMSLTGAMRSVDTLVLEQLMKELMCCKYINYTPEGQKVICYLKSDDIAKKLEK